MSTKTVKTTRDAITRALASARMRSVELDDPTVNADDVMMHLRASVRGTGGGVAAGAQVASAILAGTRDRPALIVTVIGLTGEPNAPTIPSSATTVSLIDYTKRPPEHTSWIARKPKGTQS